MIPRVVFDTNTIVSALLFEQGRLAWLRPHWRERSCTPLLSHATAAELTRVLTYPKFQLTSDDRFELLGDYIPHCQQVDVSEACPQRCCDASDQIFLDLAHCAKADVLVTGDSDLLALADWTYFAIETPEAYRKRVTSR